MKDQHIGNLHRVVAAVLGAAGTTLFAWGAISADDERRFAACLVLAVLIGIFTAFLARDALRGRAGRFRPGSVPLQPLTLQSPPPAAAHAVVTIATGSDPFQLNAAMDALREEGYDAALVEQEGSSLLGFLGVQMRVVVPGHEAEAAHAFLEAFVTATV